MLILLSWMVSKDGKIKINQMIVNQNIPKVDRANNQDKVYD